MIQGLIDQYNDTNTISTDMFDEMENNREFRLSLIDYFNENKNRAFVLKSLDQMIEIRDNNGIMSGDNLMLGAYLLGKHKQVEDCLKIWEAKVIDFDTYCYIDIQLVTFAGVHETIKFLNGSSSKDAGPALDYILKCNEAGEFDDLQDYYANIPWFV